MRVKSVANNIMTHALCHQKAWCLTLQSFSEALRTLIVLFDDVFKQAAAVLGGKRQGRVVNV